MIGCSSDEIVEPDYYDDQKITFKIPASSDSTAILFAVPNDGKTQLYILNTSGQRVRLLLNELLVEGLYREYWDLKDEDRNRVDVGVYCIALIVEEHSYIRWFEIY